MALPPATIGVSSSILVGDARREVYDGRPLSYVEQSMAGWLMQAGVRPYVVPFARPVLDSPGVVDRLVGGVDGLVLQGGVDVAPQTYGADHLAQRWPGDAERDAYEIALIEACMRLDRPILGICRGHQMLNVARNGTLVQDIATQIDDALAHDDRKLYERNHHPIDIEPHSRLSQIYGGQVAGVVNSVHHQAVAELGDDVVVEATAADGAVVEAIRLDVAERWAMGLQWHPEFQHADEHGLLDRFVVLDAFLAAVDARRSSG